MKQKLTSNDVLNELGFTKEEKDAFVSCIKAVKQEQNDENFKAEDEIARIIVEVTNNENK
jgi:hypothetical protein